MATHSVAGISIVLQSKCVVVLSILAKNYLVNLFSLNRASFIFILACLGSGSIASAQDNPNREASYPIELDMASQIKDGQRFRSEHGISWFDDELWDAKTGSIKHRSVDLVLKGTGPDIEVARTHTPLYRYQHSMWQLYPTDIYFNPSGGYPWGFSGSQHHLGNMRFDVPRISSSPNKGCGVAASQEHIGLKIKGGEIVFLHRSEIDPTLLTQYPSDATFVSESNWILKCTDGIGYTALSPDGSKYTFSDFGFEGDTYAYWYVSRIEDIHGNSISYQYSAPGYLTGITGSDGRIISVVSNPSGGQTCASLPSGLESETDPSKNVSYTYAEYGYSNASSFLNIPNPIGKDREWDLNGNSLFPRGDDVDLYVDYFNNKRELYLNEYNRHTYCALDKASFKNNEFTQYTYEESRNNERRINPTFGSNRNYNSSTEYLLIGERVRTVSRRIKAITHRTGASVTYTYGPRNMCDYQERSCYPFNMSYRYLFLKYSIATGAAEELDELEKYIPTRVDSEVLIQRQVKSPQDETLASHIFNYQIGGSSDHGHKTTKTTISGGDRLVTLNYGKDTSFISSSTGSHTFFSEHNRITGTDRYVAWDEQSVESGRLLRKEISDSVNASPLRIEKYAYYLKNNLGKSDAAISRQFSLAETRMVRPQSIIIEQDGNTFSLQFGEYDSYGFPLTVAEYQNDYGRTLRYSYEHNNSLWIMGQIVDESIGQETARTTRTYYPNSGNLYTETIGKITTTFHYDPKGRLSKVVDGENNEYRMENYHPLGIARSEIRTHQLNTEVNRTKVVDSTGRVTQEENWLGGMTVFSYTDPLGRVSSIKQPLVATKTIAYPEWTNQNDANYSKMTVLSGDRYKQVITYDSLGRPIKSSSSGTNGLPGDKPVYLHRKYDSNGRTTFRSYATYVANIDDSKGYLFSYDALDRVTEILNTADNTRVRNCYGTVCNSIAPYSVLPLNSFGISSVDQKGVVSVINYRSLAGPVYQNPMDIYESVSVDGSKYKHTSFTRDRHYRIRSVSQQTIGLAGDQLNSVHERTFVYKPDTHQLDHEINPETGRTNYQEYDLAGNLTKISVNGQNPTEYEYGSGNLIGKINYPNGGGETRYTYNSDRSVATVTRADITIATVPRVDGRLKSETTSIMDANKSYRMSYVYDDYGNPKAVTYPDQTILSTSYDAEGKLNSIDGYVDELLYYANGQLANMLYSNGVRFTSGIWPDYLPKEWQYSRQSDRLMSHEYTYDNNNNIMRIDDGVHSANTLRDMVYDGLNRLRQVDGNWGQGSIGYDSIGNIERKHLGSEILDYEYDPETARLAAVRSSSGNHDYDYQYDLYGNTMGNGVLDLDFDSGSRLTSAVSGFEAFEYRYDGNGRRVVVGSVNLATEMVTNQYFIYGQSGKLLHSENPRKGISTNYIYANDKLIARQVSFTNDLDTDSDGIPDYFEERYGLMSTFPGDSSADYDGDGLTNLQEYLSNNNPYSIDTDGDGNNDQPLQNDDDDGGGSGVDSNAMMSIFKILLLDPSAVN